MEINVDIKDKKKFSVNGLLRKDIEAKPGVYTPVPPDASHKHEDRVVNVNNKLFLHVDKDHIEVMDDAHWAELTNHTFAVADNESVKIEFKNNKTK